MTCKKHCLHWEVCKLTPLEYATAKYYTFCCCAEKCECFKDKSKYIELPCNVGDKIYYTHPEHLDGQIEKHIVTGICFDNQGFRIRTYNPKGVICYFYPDFIGKSVFLTREEAEKKFEEKE